MGSSYFFQTDHIRQPPNSAIFSFSSFFDRSHADVCLKWLDDFLDSCVSSKTTFLDKVILISRLIRYNQ